jgi:hypothetical protein
LPANSCHSVEPTRRSFSRTCQTSQLPSNHAQSLSWDAAGAAARTAEERRRAKQREAITSRQDSDES